MTLDDTIALITESSREAGIPTDKVAKLVADLKQAAEEAKADRGSAPKAKTAMHILVSDPDGKLKGLNLVGWVVQTEETAAPQEAYTRILEAAREFNNSKRGRKAPLDTLGSAIQALKGKWLKRNDGTKLTIPKAARNPLPIMAYANALPR